MLLADNLMFGCYGIARQVEGLGRRLPTWELTNGMSSFPIWVTLQSVLSIQLKLGISQQKGYHSGRDEDSTLGLHRVENCRLWGRCG